MTAYQKKMVGSILWSAVDVVLRQGIQFIILVVMARLLSPDDFGLIALLALFLGLANVFIDGGFSSALIQRKGVTHVDESTVFFLNLAMGFLTSSVLCAFAPFFAQTFGKPALRELIYAMAANLMISAFGAIHTTLLTKELNLKLIAKISGVASTVSGVLALYLAVEGFGVWSLATQIIAASVVTTLLLWCWHPWRPLWAFSFSSLRSYFKYGGYLMLASVIEILHTNLYSLLIGKFYDIRQVGFYDRAQKTQLLPVNIIMLIINRVTFSAFSSFAEDNSRLTNSFRKAQRLAMFVNAPLSTTFIAMAAPLIVTLFGEKWLPCAPILQVLGLVGMMWPVQILNINVLKAMGHSHLYFNLVLIKKTVAIALTIIGSFYGIMAIAWAQVISSLFSLMINSYYSKILLNYGAFKQLRDLFPCLVTSALAGIVMWFVLIIHPTPNTTGLLIASSVGAVFYLLASFFLRMNEISEIIDLIRKYRKVT